MKKLHFLLFFIIFLLAFSLRLYKLSSPVADWHSWRQSDTAAVARNFIKFGFEPLLPRFDDLSNIPSGKDNPSGWRMAEFPLYQLIGTGIYKLFPQYTIEIWLRLITIAASALTAVLLGLLVYMIINPLTGILTSLIFAIFPYSIYFGRIILPDPFMVFWAVFSILLLYLAFRDKKIQLILLTLSAVAAGLSLLVKPMAVFLLMPEAYLFLKNFKFSISWLFTVILFGAIALIPVILWRQWILQFPEGIPAYLWLFNEGNIRFKGAWFYWLFSQRLSKIILGHWLLIPFGLGILVNPEKREGWFFRWWIAGVLLYWIIIARGNVQHDYYQILVLPVVSVYVARGIAYLITNQQFNRLVSLSVVFVSVIFGLAFSWYNVRSNYWINHPEIIEAGMAADKLLPENAKVIAAYGGDTTFLYQTKRQGWPIGFSIEQKIKDGAQYYISTSPSDDEVKALRGYFPVLTETDSYIIIDLRRRLKTGGTGTMKLP